jgi:hypothetical protein
VGPLPTVRIVFSRLRVEGRNPWFSPSHDSITIPLMVKTHWRLPPTKTKDDGQSERQAFDLSPITPARMPVLVLL